MKRMDNLLSLVEPLTATKWGLVVHVGADRATLELHSRLKADRRILVQGDPETAADMATALDAPTVLVDRPVAQAAVAVRWHRYNVRSLNGLLDASTLVRFYPRLRQAGVLSLQACGFEEVLHSALNGLDALSPCVLILDVPGQEAGLLGAIPSHLLARFHWIIVRGCNDGIDRERAPLSVAVHQLQELGYVVEGAPADDPLWPAVALQLDLARWNALEQQRHERQARERIETLEGELLRFEVQHGALAAKLRETETALQQTCTEVTRTAEELSASQRQSEELAQTLLRGDAHLAVREATIRQQETRIKDLENQVADRAARVGQVEQASSAKSVRIAELESSLIDMTAGLAQARDEHAALRMSTLQREELLAERERQLAQLSAASAGKDQRLLDLEKKMADLRESLIGSQAEAATLRRNAEDLTQRLLAAQTQARDATARVDELAASSSRLQEQINERTRRVGDLEQSSGAKSVRISELEMARDTAEAVLADAELSRAHLQQQVETLQAALSRSEGESQQRQRHVWELEQASSGKSQIIDAVQRDLAVARDDVAERERQLADKDHVIANRSARILEAEQAWTAQGQRLDQVRRQLEDQQRATTELQVRVDALGKERTALVAARDEQTRAAATAKQRTAAVEADLVEVNARYGLLQEELIKAEAQIELIADLLLREPRP